MSYTTHLLEGGGGGGANHVNNLAACLFAFLKHDKLVLLSENVTQEATCYKEMEERRKYY